MISTGTWVRRSPFCGVMAVAAFLAAGPAFAQSKGNAIYEGASVRVGHGTARTVVRTDAAGNPKSIGVVFTPGMLNGLPTPMKAKTDFAFALPMPTKGPKTVIDHVVIDWESAGHPPPHVYDVQHFDFHFYLVSRADQMKVAFTDDTQSGDPSQQPAAELLPAGYIVPPGTAVPQMGVHAINPAGAEFHDQPFTATFIYGYYDKRQTFLEPMVSLAFLKSEPSFSAPVMRPAAYSRPGAYPAAYSVKYDAGHNLYAVTLEGLTP